MSSDLLCLEHICKSFWRGPHETVVLADVSLAVRSGELVVIWGQRGSGKTTLARLAAGLGRPDDGAVRFRGRDFAEMQRRSLPLLNEQIGWVRRGRVQTDGLRTVADDVAVPLLGKLSPRKAKRRAAAVLRELGVGECADAKWGSLTDGQRTLVAIARAFVRGPQLLVADDPTAYLNALQREEVMRLLRAACSEQGIGVLATVPDMPEIAHADQIGSLSDGRLIMPREPQPENVVEFRRRGRSAS